MTTAAANGPYIAVHDHVFERGGPDDTPPLYIFGDCEYPNETASDVAALLNRAYAAGVAQERERCCAEVEARIGTSESMGELLDTIRRPDGGE